MVLISSITTAHTQMHNCRAHTNAQLPNSTGSTPTLQNLQGNSIKLRWHHCTSACLLSSTHAVATISHQQICHSIDIDVAAPCIMLPYTRSPILQILLYTKTCQDFTTSMPVIYVALTASTTGDLCLHPFLRHSWFDRVMGHFVHRP